MSRSPALSQLFVEVVGRFAEMSGDGRCHINCVEMSDLYSGQMESGDLNYPLLRPLPISCCFGGDKSTNEEC